MNDWQNMKTAPRDGTVVEIKNAYGLMPTYGRGKFDQHRGWIDASDPDKGWFDERSLFWRPDSGVDIESFNPTDEDWRRAVRMVR